MLGGSQGLGGASQRTGGFWPLASTPVSPASFTSDGYSKYGFYSLFSGAPTFGSTLYSQNTVGRFGPALQTPGGTAFHTTHKVSDSLFSATGYTFGAPTPPPGSPYSPVPVAQLEFLAKGYTTTTNSNIIIQQSPICQPELTTSCTPSPKKPNNIIITPTEKDLQMNKINSCNSGSAFRHSQSTFKHQQAQYIYAQQPNTSIDGSCMLKLTTLTSSSDNKDCHGGGANITGCSRTNPLEWTTLSPIHVKKEPGTLVLSDINGGQGEAIIKMEMTSPVTKTTHHHHHHQEMIQTSMPSIVTANGNIPVGIAVGRQRIQQEVAPSGILTTTHFKEVARISEIADLNAAAAAAAAAHHAAAMQQHHHHHHNQIHGGASSATSAATGMLGSAAGASWGLMGAHHQQHCHQGSPGGTAAQQLNQNGATTLWTTQYPAPLPMEPLLPMSAVGLPLQLIREPTSGGFLLFPTAGIEPVQQAAAIQLWPSASSTTTYPTPTPGHVILPPLPPPPLQLLTSQQQHQQNHDSYLSTMINAATSSTNGTGFITTISNSAGQQTINPSARLHLVSSNNHFDQNAAKLITKGVNCKVSSSLGAVIKVEEGTIMHQSSAATCHNEQQVNPSSLQIFESAPPVLTTTHLIYQPTQTSMITSQTSTTIPTPELSLSTNQNTVFTSTATCRSQATSPVTCLTPPPEACNGAMIQEEHHVIAEEVKSAQLVPENDVITKQVVEEKLVQDASNQTESVSDEESATMQETNVPNLKSDTSKEDEVITPSSVDKTEDATPLNLSNETEVCKPDFSGLDLLSNSILEHETSKIVVNEEPPEKIVPEDMIIKPLPIVEENLGGLHLLCALAEQRLEEVTSTSKNVKPDLVKSRRDAIDDIETEEPEVKKAKITLEEQCLPRRCNNCNCNVDEEPFKSYRTKESEQEFKKFIASKAPSLMEYNYKEMTANGLMNDSERDMRQQLADLQRKYKEKQRELNKLKPHHSGGSKKTHVVDCTTQQRKKHRKKSTNSNSTDRDTSPQPPVLEPQVDLATLQHKMGTTNDEAPNKVIETAANKVIEKRRHSSSNSSSSTSKRRRKVGRPKKLEWSSDNESSSNNFIGNTSTETIVAKKPKKTHQNLVGHLLAAKEKLLVQKGYSNSPPRFVEEAPVKPSTNNKKIGPKLKAEARISLDMSDDFLEEDIENKKEDSNKMDEDPSGTESDNDDQQVNSTTETSALAESSTKDAESTEILPEPTEDSTTGSTQEECSRPVDSRCILTRELLESDRLRVLTAMAGLFYAGNLNAIQPPDVYSITLDGERGNRPHIMSREEILRDAIVEVSPSSTEDLTPGTRLCAYWSQQYRCLYPGSVAEPASPSASPKEVDKRFVAVEFDDGDNGTIAIEDIRLLPSDYPIIEYDPNPLLSLSKRKRRLSTTEDCKFTQSPPLKSLPQIQNSHQAVEKENKDVNTNIIKSDENELQVQRNKERKRLKKRKREKLRDKQRCLIDGELKKKKKRKHKCLGEQCKHRRHHKKHRKHRKHHQRDKRAVRDKKPTEKQALDDIKEVAEEESEEALPEFPEYHIVPNPDDAVNMDDIIDANSKAKSKKIRDRQESCESRSKMSAFLPPRQFWSWSGKGYKRPRGKGRSKKEFFKSIQRGKENMSLGDSAVFLSTGRPDRPYIGKIEAFWETCGTMVVKVKWFYHPEETNGCPLNLKYPGALFESPHIDENDVQTISHRCRVVPLPEYTATLGSDPTRYATIYDNNDIYYRAGYYDPTSCQLSMDPDIPLEDE